MADHRRHVDWRAALYGGIAAMLGSACMTVVRSAARRAGLIEKTVPQVVEESLASYLDVESGGSPSLHEAADQMLHLTYGTAWGAGYGALLGSRVFRTVPAGVALGAGTWLIGSGLILPLTGASRGIWRRTPVENGVDLFAHIVFGVATELVRGDLIAHTERRRPTRHRRRAARAG